MKGNITLMLYLHVDDSAIAGQQEQDIDAFAAKVDAQVPCTKGKLRRFLGIDIERDRSRRTVWITQSVHTKSFGMLNANYLSTPLSQSTRLEKGSDADHAAASHLPYRELIAPLQYLATMTRPDIVVAVSKLGSYDSRCTKKDIEARKALLRCIIGTRRYGTALGERTRHLC